MQFDMAGDALHPDTLPWEFDQSISDEHGNSAIVDAQKVVVAFMSDDGLDDEEADGIITDRALIMAASPELAVALRIARRYVADLPIVGDEDLAIIDAALAKAGLGPKER